MVNMSDYTPPFSISNKMLGFVSSISEKIGKIAIIMILNQNLS